MALLDENVKSLPGIRKALAVSFASAVANALLIAGQAVGLSCALSNLWEGLALLDQALWIALFALCFALRQLLKFAQDGYLDSYARKTASYLRRMLADSVYDAGTQAVQENGSGALVSTLAEGVDQVRTYLALVLPKLAELIVIPTLLSIALLALDLISGVIALVILPCIVFYMRLLGGFAKEAAAAQHGKYQQLSNHFVDALKGMATLKVFGRSKPYAQNVYQASERLRTATVKTLRAATLSSLALDLFRVFALAAVAIMFGFRLLGGSAELFNALAVLIIVPEYFGAVRRFSTDFHASLDGRNQLAAILNVAAQTEAAKARTLPGVSLDGEHLELAHVSYTYPGASAPALENINLQVTLPAQAEATRPLRIGIVGASGSGKSTFARLVAGFNGGALSCSQWQQRVAFIPQTPHIFHGTLQENIAFYCPDASVDRIAAAARNAGLDQLIEQLPHGLDTVIGEAGRSLSGGQAQRVAVARAFLDTKRDILILDEPTAHLDIETEVEIKKTMLPLMEGKLVFLATHRLHWMKDMDLILVLEDGKVVESGAYDELLAADGAFTRFVAQMRGEVVAQ